MQFFLRRALSHGIHNSKGCGWKLPKKEYENNGRSHANNLKKFESERTHRKEVFRANDKATKGWKRLKDLL